MKLRGYHFWVVFLFNFISAQHIDSTEGKQQEEEQAKLSITQLQTIDSLNKQAKKFEDKGKYISAIKVLKNINSIVPEESSNIRVYHYFDIGHNYLRARVLDSCKYYYKKADTLLDDKASNKLKSIRYKYWGDYYYAKSQVDSSMAYLLKALDYANISNDHYQILNAENSIGRIFLSQKSYSKAHEYFQKTLEKATSMRDSLWISVSKMNIGQLDYEQKNYKQAENYLNEALVYFNSNSLNNNILICKSFLSKIYLETGQFDKAMKMGIELMPVLKEFEFKNDAKILVDNAIKLNDIAQKESLSKKNIKAADSLIKISLKTTKEPRVIAEQSKAILNEAKVLDSNNIKQNLSVLQDKNLSEMFDKAVSIKDSFYQESLRSQYKEIEVKYQTEKKEKALLMLKNDNFKKEIKLLEESKKRQWLYLIIGFVSALVVFMAFYAKNRKRKLLWENKLAIAKAVQKEHNQIGRNLHDTKAKEIEVLALQLKKKGENTIAHQLENIRADIRQLSHELSEVSFEDSEFDEQLINTAVSYHNENFEIVIDGLNDFQWQSINNTVKRNLFIIVREGISNAHKHSNATKMTITFSKFKNKLNLEIADNGEGMNDVNPSGGLGFKNIKVRVNELNGKVRFKSIKNQGTHILITLALA